MWLRGTDAADVVPVVARVAGGTQTTTVVVQEVTIGFIESRSRPPVPVRRRIAEGARIVVPAINWTKGVFVGSYTINTIGSR